MTSSNIEKILKTIKIVLTICGINAFVDFKNHNIFYRIHGIINAFFVIFVYTSGFYYDFWLMLTTKNISASFFLGNSVIGISTTVMRAMLLVINRNEFTFLMNWLKEIYEDSEDEKYKNTILKSTAEKILKAWK